MDKTKSNKGLKKSKLKRTQAAVSNPTDNEAKSIEGPEADKVSLNTRTKVRKEKTFIHDGKASSSIAKSNSKGTFILHSNECEATLPHSSTNNLVSKKRKINVSAKKTKVLPKSVISPAKKKRKQVKAATFGFIVTDVTPQPKRVVNLPSETPSTSTTIREIKKTPARNTRPHLLVNDKAKKIVLSPLGRQDKVVKPKSSVKKVPNYAEIHRKAFDKMESVDTYLQRKNNRAIALLSGKKVPAAIEKSATSCKDKPDTGKSATKKSGFSFNPPRFSGIFPLSDKDSVKSDDSRPKLLRSRLPIKLPNDKVAFPFNLPVAKINPLQVKIDTTENSKNLRQEQIRSVVTRARGRAGGIENRRDHISGVRSNRRFDLLMNMRQNFKNAGT